MSTAAAILPGLIGALLLSAVGAAPAAYGSSGQGTVISVSPREVSPLATMTITGTSNCQNMFIDLAYRDVNSGDFEHTGVLTEGTFDEQSRRWSFSAELGVPEAASEESDGTVQAESACGDADDGFPPSDPLVVPINRAVLALAVAPARQQAGRTVALRGGMCVGDTDGRVRLRLRGPNGPTMLTAQLKAGRLAANFTIPRKASPGTVHVDVAEEDCPRSSRKPGSFVVTAAPTSTPTALSRPTAASSRPSPSPSRSPSPGPVALRPSGPPLPATTVAAGGTPAAEALDGPTDNPNASTSPAAPQSGVPALWLALVILLALVPATVVLRRIRRR